MFDTPVIYGFVSDKLFWNRKLVDFNKEVASPVGFIDDVTINYFHRIGYINDNRTTRIDDGGVEHTGDISVFFDSSKLEDTNPFKNITDEHISVLMNIIERCYITQNRTEDELNIELAGDLYKPLFVADSARRSTSYITVTLPNTTTKLKIYDYVEFEIVVDGNHTRFKLWLNLDKFKKDYPLTTIVSVIPPCKEEYLLNPSLVTSDVLSIVESGEFIFSRTHAGVVGIDYTGILSYKTRWIISSQNAPEIRFGVMYQGAAPSSLEAREAIRNYLNSTGLAPETTWESKLPDLYITAQFFIIPLWGNKVAKANNKYGYIYPAISNYTDIQGETQRILPTMELGWLSDHTEIVLNPFNPILLVSVPDPLNKLGYLSMHKLMDTYQAFGPDDINYQYQEYNAKDFSRKLGNVMSTLYGNIVSGVFTTNTFYGRRYLSFSSDKVEYHVLYSEDYDIVVEE